MNHLINLASEYFNAWNINDVEQLKPLFHEDIELTDWDVSVSGFDKVIETNDKIFKGATGIRAEILGMTTGENVVSAQLRIHIPENELRGAEVIDVVDIITFTNNKVSSIRAYKG